MSREEPSVIETARRSLHRLIGERWRSAGRAAGMAWMGFGACREVSDRGGTRELADYALHVDCEFRVRHGEQIVTGQADMWRPRPGWTGEGDFDWDVQGANRYDVRAQQLTAHLAAEPVVVTSVDVAAWGDLTISLSDGFLIEVLRLRSVRDEHWRFFRPHLDDEHVVVFPED